MASSKSEPNSAKTEQRIVDIQGAVLTRLLTAPVKVRLEGRSRSVTVLQLIVQQVWSRTLRGDDRAKARKILMGYVRLVPKSERAAVSVALEENTYTASVARLVNGGGDGG